MRFATALLALAFCLPVAAQAPKDPEADFMDACDDIERLFKNEPENLEKQDAAIKRLKELAQSEAQIAMFNQLKVYFNNQVALMQRTLVAFRDGEAARDEVGKGGDIDEIRKKWRAVAKSVRQPGGLYDKKREKWRDLMLEVIGELRRRGEKARSANPSDWVGAGKAFRLAVEVSETGPHALALNQDLPALLKDEQAALEKMYFATKWADAIAWQDALDAAMGLKADAWVQTTRDNGALVLDNASEKDAILEMERAASWRDYNVKMELTVEEGSGFAIQLRKSPKSHAQFNYDLGPAMKAGTLKSGARAAIEFSVFAGKAKMTVGATELGSPRANPYGPGSGGFALRLPPGSKITIHKCEVRILYSDE